MTIKAAPIVHKMAKEDGVDLSSIVGTGNNGTITKIDYEAHTGKKIKEVIREERAPMNHATDQESVGGMTFRRGRGAMDHSARNSLGVPDRYLNKDLEYRWVNDDNGRVERLRELGYEVVDSKALSKDEEISVRRRVGTKTDGSQLNAVLMATPKKWKQERHQKSEEERSDKEMGMFKSPQDESGRPLDNNFYKKRGVDSGYRAQ